MVVSDHGFTNFDYKVHLNRWLLERGYLQARDESGARGSGGMRDIAWPETRAYALGLNSLYLNLRGRERDGRVPPEHEAGLVNELSQSLEAWTGPDGRPVVARAIPRAKVFEGSLADRGPDVIVGYSPGYRGSAETGLAQWGSASVVANHDHWGADHCVYSESVPGVLFARHGVGEVDRPSYKDVPWLAIGKAPDSSAVAPAPSNAEEDMETVEERLRSLGYL
jgi:predicted AlkP superfamily phosphohydrolase/phosphomutase